MKVRWSACVIAPNEAMPLFQDSGCVGEHILHGDFEENAPIWESDVRETSRLYLSHLRRNRHKRQQAHKQ